MHPILSKLIEVVKYIYTLIRMYWNTPYFGVCLFVVIFVVALILKRFKPKFLYDTLSFFYKDNNSCKEGFRFDKLQKIMKEDEEKQDKVKNEI
tara:strand:- start:220 stop:498 length:279 start_codon:yes stop_codon:yes gene_type:complete